MVSFAADALKRLVICNRIIRPTSGTIDRSISSSSHPLPPSLPRRSQPPFTVRPRLYGECRDREAHSDRLRNGTGTGLYLSTENRISISEPGHNPRPQPPSSPLPASTRSFYPGGHKDVQDFPRILLRKSPGSASAMRSSEHRGAGWRERWTRGRREDRRKLLLVIRVATNEPCSLHFPIVITLLVISSLGRGRLFCFYAR